FKKALEGDPSCGIAQWGIAMSTWGNPFAGLRSPKTLQEGLAAAQTAQTIGAKSDREREYIAAVALLYKDADTLDHRARTVAYEKAMERIYTKYPTDLEAAAFYALAVDQTALPTDKTYANQLKAAAILEKLYTVEPDHPGVTHYLIHSYDVSALAPRARRRRPVAAPTCRACRPCRECPAGPRADGPRPRFRRAGPSSAARGRRQRH